MSDALQAAQEYFQQLNEAEQYAWIAEIVGFIVVIVGIILLF
jgi:hypothetical protein